MQYMDRTTKKLNDIKVKRLSEYLKPYFLSPSYCLLSVDDTTIDIIKEYIESQDKEIL